MKIIASGDNPILSGDKSNSPNRHISDIKCLQQHLTDIVVEVCLSTVKATDDPIFGRVKVDSLDTVGAIEQQLFDLCAFTLQKLRQRKYAHPGGLGENIPLCSEERKLIFAICATRGGAGTRFNLVCSFSANHEVRNDRTAEQNKEKINKYVKLHSYCQDRVQGSFEALPAPKPVTK